MRSYAVTFLGYSVGDAWGCGGVRVIYAPIVPATKKGIFERHIVQRSYAALLSSVLDAPHVHLDTVRKRFEQVLAEADSDARYLLESAI